MHKRWFLHQREFKYSIERKCIKNQRYFNVDLSLREYHRKRNFIVNGSILLRICFLNCM